METSNPEKTGQAAPRTSMAGSIFLDIAARNDSPETQDKDIDPFENVHVPRPNDWTIAQAYMCVLLAAVYADKVAVPEEVEYVRSLVRRCRTMRGMHQNRLAELDTEVRERMRSRHDYLGEVCEAMPRDMHLALFTHCVDIVLADGVLEDSEREFLDALIDKMDMTKAQAQKVMEVMFEKNRY